MPGKRSMRWTVALPATCIFYLAAGSNGFGLPGRVLCIGRVAERQEAAPCGDIRGLFMHPNAGWAWSLSLWPLCLCGSFLDLVRYELNHILPMSTIDQQWPWPRDAPCFARPIPHDSSRFCIHSIHFIDFTEFASWSQIPSSAKTRCRHVVSTPE